MLTFPKGKGIPQGIYVISSVCLSFYLWKDLVGVFFSLYLQTHQIQKNLLVYFISSLVLSSIHSHNSSGSVPTNSKLSLSKPPSSPAVLELTVSLLPRE